MEDLELLEMLRRAPEAGMRALMEQYGGLVWAIVRRRLPEKTFPAADVEGCAADTFSEFYLELDRYDPGRGSIRSWLCAIARHNAADLARRRVRTLQLEEGMSAPTAGPLPESDLEKRELRRAVLEAVKALAQPDRDILLRKFYLGETSRQIAARLGMSVSNVDTRTSRAVKKLRKELTEWRESP